MFFEETSGKIVVKLNFVEARVLWHYLNVAEKKSRREYVETYGLNGKMVEQLGNYLWSDLDMLLIELSRNGQPVVSPYNRLFFGKEKEIESESQILDRMLETLEVLFDSRQKNAINRGLKALREEEGRPFVPVTE